MIGKIWEKSASEHCEAAMLRSGNRGARLDPDKVFALVGFDLPGIPL
jgi:hypothetical protein